MIVCNKSHPLQAAIVWKANRCLEIVCIPALPDEAVSGGGGLATAQQPPPLPHLLQPALQAWRPNCPEGCLPF